VAAALPWRAENENAPVPEERGVSRENGQLRTVTERVVVNDTWSPASMPTW
jgi:hypothetical protein